MKVIKAFAPGEIILFGEHSVVYGRKALAVSIERGITSKFYPSDGIRVESNMGFLKACVDGEKVVPSGDVSKHMEPFVAMIERCFSVARCSRGFRTVIVSDIPACSGLASSAAVSASFIAGLLTFLGSPAERSQLLDMVFASEIDIQKRGSKIGSACAVYGGMIEVCDGMVKKHSLPYGLDDVVIVNSKEICPTFMTTGIVRKKMEEDPVGVQKIFDDMHRIACDGQKIIANMDKTSLGRLLNENQKHLNALGVSTKIINRYIVDVEKYVYGTKITGAGGGGCVFSLVKEKASHEVFRVVESLGLEAFSVSFRGGGVEVKGELA